MPEFKSLPGFRDFYPEAFSQRRFLFQIWRQVAVRFGFREFDGPVLESLELFKAKSGDEIEGQLFSFEDKGGREVSLRPELTPHGWGSSEFAQKADQMVQHWR
jgi:histidyl-tRNA synthetase